MIGVSYISLVESRVLRVSAREPFDIFVDTEPREIVEKSNFEPFVNQSFREVRTDESSAASNHGALTTRRRTYFRRRPGGCEQRIKTVFRPALVKQLGTSVGAQQSIMKITLIRVSRICKCRLRRAIE